METGGSGCLGEIRVGPGKPGKLPEEGRRRCRPVPCCLGAASILRVDVSPARSTSDFDSWQTRVASWRWLSIASHRYSVFCTLVRSIFIMLPFTSDQQEFRPKNRTTRHHRVVIHTAVKPLSSRVRSEHLTPRPQLCPATSSQKPWMPLSLKSNRYLMAEYTAAADKGGLRNTLPPRLQILVMPFHT